MPDTGIKVMLSEPGGTFPLLGEIVSAEILPGGVLQVRFADDERRWYAPTYWARVSGL